MKSVLLIALALLLTGQAQAQGKQEKLICSSGQAYETFRAILDYSGYVPSSGFFQVKGASIIDNYASASLHCTGHRLDEIVCVGFWFDHAGEIAEVKLSRRNKNLQVRYSSLKGTLMGAGGGWPCRTEEI